LKMKFLQAGMAVLAQKRRPMSAREVVEVALEQGLLKTRGSTPAATMSAAFYRENVRPDSRVRKIAEAGPIRARAGTVQWELVPVRKNRR
jgi:hypothetical protein